MNNVDKTNTKYKRKEKIVKNSKVYYGATFLEEKDLVESNIKNNIELKYYKIENYERKILKREKLSYGIEIVKKEYTNENIKIEKNTIENITDNAAKVINIIETLKKYKVTPIGLQDVVSDLLKQNMTKQGIDKTSNRL